MLTLITFLLFTGLVAVATWWLTRGKNTDTEDGFFLAGRSLGGLVIAGSLLLTNLSTEQLVGLNGDAFKEGLSVMAWEVIAGVSLVFMALFFLPRYLKSGITTIPQFLEERYDARVRAITTGVFIIAYMLILLPFVLFSGAKALSYMLDLPTFLGMSDEAIIWLVVAIIAIVGSGYAIFGGLRAVAVSDMFNGVGLLVGGLLITYFSLSFAAGDGSIVEVFGKISEARPDAFKSLGTAEESVSWPTLFTGVLLLNVFYWCSNQQIIQRTFGAKNLAEGQKGILLASFFKILAPIILVLPGIVAFYVASTNPEFKTTLLGANGEADGSRVYGSMVRLVLPGWLTGFFAAVIVGSILSSFNSVLNSSATLFSLGVYKKAIRPNAKTREVVASGRWCSLLVALFSAISAPMIFMGRDSIFGYFQNLNGVYFIPLLAIILVGMFHKTANATSAIISISVGLVIMLCGTFIATKEQVEAVFGSGFHFMGAVFVGVVILQLALATSMKRDTPYVQQNAGVVDITPWPLAKPVGIGLIVLVLGIYAYFA